MLLGVVFVDFLMDYVFFMFLDNGCFGVFIELLVGFILVGDVLDWVVGLFLMV